MELLDKPVRDDLGIDSIGRGIAFASHLLKISLPSANIQLSYVESVADEVLTGKLTIVAKVFYDKATFLGSGSNYLNGILPNIGTLPSVVFDPMEPSNLGLPLPDEPIEVVTLEAYLVWLILAYKETGLIADPINLSLVNISQGESGTDFYKTFTVILPYDPIRFITVGNIIEALTV